ncbi:MAG TPA: hypothetical protein VGG21_04355 [Acidimicrobiales bacterium]|jgi:type II secretory pathway pseudopilin PulG
MTLAILVVAILLLVAVFYWSGRYGDRKRSAGTSLKRGVRSHTTARGQAKKSYPSREDALSHSRDGMSAYQCDTCGKWHLGH